MSKRKTKPLDLEQVRKVAAVVAKWPQWKRGGSAAAKTAAASTTRKKRKD